MVLVDERSVYKRKEREKKMDLIKRKNKTK
jgi:hypothetical protein